MPGPPKTPTPILKLRGSFRKDRHGDRADIGGHCLRLPTPQGLSEAMQAIFNELADSLQNVTTPADGPALLLLADAMRDYRQARDIVEAEGLIIEGSKGKIAHPANRVMRDAWQRVMKAMQSFGLTPASRAALKITAPTAKPDGNGKARFFKRED